MAEAKLAPETITKDVEETKYINFEFAADLDTALLVSVTSITVETGGGALTIDEITDDNVSKAQCRIAGGTSGVLYTLKAIVVDDSSPTQTFVGRGKVNVP